MCWGPDPAGAEVCGECDLMGNLGRGRVVVVLRVRWCVCWVGSVVGGGGCFVCGVMLGDGCVGGGSDGMCVGGDRDGVNVWGGLGVVKKGIR